MSKSNTVLIVNPNARGGRVGRTWPEKERHVRAALGELSVQYTRGCGDATRLCHRALDQGARLVVAVGGDGTASEVVAGFLLAGARPHDGVACAYLPCGTGGDLRRTYQSPSEVVAAAHAIAIATPRPVDVGQLDYLSHRGEPARTYFLNVAGFGLTGLGDQLVNRSRKRLGSRATFYLAALQATLRYHNVPVAMRLDDGPEQQTRIYNVAVANGRFFGGGMQIAPHAEPGDGLFDVVTMGDLRFLEVLALTGSIYQGRHLDRPKIALARARTVVARPLGPADEVLLDVDGENPGRLPATFTMLPAALLLRV